MKTKMQLAEQKIADIETMFDKLKNYLSQKKPLKGKYKTLADGIKDYTLGLKSCEDPLCYAACVKVYQVFKLKKYLGDSTLKARIKSMMRAIAKEYFTENNSLQLTIF